MSYQEILKLLGLLGREDFKDRVFRGSERYMTVKDQPVDSDAARDLVKEFMNVKMYFMSLQLARLQTLLPLF